MVYVEPVTRALGDDIFVEDWNRDVVENIKYLKGIVDSMLPPGIIIPYVYFLPIPAGWLLCQGQAISRSTYSALFAVMGGNYGAGNGTTTFNIPDLRGRVIVGIDDMGGVAASRLPGGTGVNNGGLNTTTLTLAEIPAHTHTLPPVSNTSGGGVNGWNGPGGAHNQATGSAGSGNAHNNLQPYQVMFYMIKT